MTTFSVIEAVISVLTEYAFYYPIVMGLLWIVGGVFFFLRWEQRGKESHTRPPPLAKYPPVSILLPCHNEGENLRDTVEWLGKCRYPDFEVLAVNDGSTDNTGEILDELAETYRWLRVIHFKKNEGKAMGLRAAAMMSDREFLVCIDGDALLDPYAVHWFVSHLVQSPRVGAITGNPRIRTRSSLIGKIQVAEFSCIVGLIKRAQSIYGRLFAISGVACAFRQSALRRVGYWSVNMVTEDVDITWRLQRDHWDVRYEPNALCWILMPETLNGLWRERLRWAQGGVEVFARYGRSLMTWRHRRMWPICLEFAASVLWAYTVAIVMAWTIVSFLMPEHMNATLLRLGPRWEGVVLASSFAMQFTVGLLIDRRFERGSARYYYWIVWYPLAFWLVSLTTTVAAVPKALLKNRNQRALWHGSDRGFRP